MSELELALAVTELALAELFYPWPWWTPIAAAGALVAGAAAIGVRMGRRAARRRWRRQF